MKTMKIITIIKRFFRATNGYPRNFFYRNLRPEGLKWKWYYASHIQQGEIDIHDEHKYITK